MKQQLNKRLLNIGSIIFSLLTILFAILSILDIRDWLFRILAQGFLGMMAMFSGIREITYENKKILGCSSIVISIFLFCVMFFTIFVAFKIGAF